LDSRIPIERLAIMEPGWTCLMERLAHGYHRSDWPPWTPSWPPSRLEGFPPAEGSCFCCVCASGSSVDGQLAQKSVGLFLRRQVVCMHLQREDVRQPSVDWWTLGIYTWEGGTPFVHLRTPLVVRSHRVLTRGPAIQTAGQSAVCQRLVQSNPWNDVVLGRHLVEFCEDNHPLQYYLYVFRKLVVQPVDHASIINPPPKAPHHA
jgi:hypothetical protein